MTDAIKGGMDGQKILGCASQGSGGDDESRLRSLLSNFDAEFVPFDKANKKQAFQTCLTLIRSRRFDLFVLEGTGVAGGVAAILGRLLYKQRYVLSSGDAVAPFLSASFPLATPIFNLYEYLLYRCSSGFIGWTPYLVGRALTMGAKYAVTIPGWPPYEPDRETLRIQRDDIRRRLGIPADALVFGIAGALVWSRRYQYCYGAELVRAARKANSAAYVLIVGDGSGLEQLRELAGPLLGKTIFLTGRVPREEVQGYLAAMDMGALPQSVDGVGSFRYSTKIAEYRNVGLPFFTNQIPMSYDLDQNDVWRLEGDSPWSDTFVGALAGLMNGLLREDLEARKQTMVQSMDFDKDRQIHRVTQFLRDVLRRH